MLRDSPKAARLCLCLCLSWCVWFQPHPDIKPMAYASTLLQLGMM